MAGLVFSGRIAFDNVTDDCADLVCPRCGHANLRHSRVAVFERLEDAETATVTTVYGDSVRMEEVDGSGPLNPSPRRNGIVIYFECEHCDDDVVLTLAQHKGATIAAWRYVRP